MQSEVGQRRLAVELRAGPLGDENLPAVAGAHDPRRAMHVDADVPLIGQQRLAGVHSHTDADHAACERRLRVGGRFDRVGGTGERVEKNASPCVSTSTPP